MWKVWAWALLVTGALVLGTGAGALANSGGNGHGKGGNSANAPGHNKGTGTGTGNGNGNGNGNGHQGNNRGDVWVDNAGQPPGPGHEMDPHLTCDDFNIWGDKMANPSGTYTIQGWSPTGSHEVVYSGTWSYNQAQGGSQILDSVDVVPLIQHAEAAGDRAVNKQGFHFKLYLSQTPIKHKTFWIGCKNGSF